MVSKRFKKLPEKTSSLQSETIEKLLPSIKKNCTTKFDESVDLNFQINNKQKKMKLILEQLLIYLEVQVKKLKLQSFVKMLKLQMPKQPEQT